MLDIRLHRQVALLLAESYTKFISERRASFFIIEGMKQVGVCCFFRGGGGSKEIMYTNVYSMVFKYSCSDCEMCFPVCST